MLRPRTGTIVSRDGNVVRIDFVTEPDPPAPRFPGAGGLRDPSYADSVKAVAAAA